MEKLSLQESLSLFRLKMDFPAWGFLLTYISLAHRISLIVVSVAQLVERLTVAQVVVGSIPIAHPIFLREVAQPG